MEELDLGRITGKSIKEVRFKEKDANGGNVYALILEDGSSIGEITAPQGNYSIEKRGEAGGVASLDDTAHIPREQLPFAKLQEGREQPADCKGAVIISVSDNAAYIWTYGRENRG